jgi:hypothetical protein
MVLKSVVVDCGCGGSTIVVVDGGADGAVVFNGHIGLES